MPGVKITQLVVSPHALARPLNVVGLFSVNLSHRLRARHAAFRRFTGLPAPLAQGSQWFTIASTPWAKTVISKDHRKKLSALMIGRSSPLLCKCRMVLNLKFGFVIRLTGKARRNRKQNNGEYLGDHAARLNASITARSALRLATPVLAYAACFTKDLLGGGLLMSQRLALLDKAADELEWKSTFNWNGGRLGNASGPRRTSGSQSKASGWASPPSRATMICASRAREAGA